VNTCTIHRLSLQIMAILYTTLTGGSKVFWYCEYLQDSSLKPPKHELKEDWSEAEHCRGVPVLNGNGMVMSMLPSTIRMTLFLERRRDALKWKWMQHSPAKTRFAMPWSFFVMFFLSDSNSPSSPCLNAHCDSRICLIYFLYSESRCSSFPIISITNIP